MKVKVGLLFHPKSLRNCTIQVTALSGPLVYYKYVSFDEKKMPGLDSDWEFSKMMFDFVRMMKPIADANKIWKELCQ
jgi:hypothetical protein